MKIIKSSDISVVVQGAIDKENTPKCLASIRKYLPDAEIILSTWEGSDVEGLDYDKVILNKDPGTFIYTRSTGDVTENNQNRQLVSIQNGLEAVNRQYTLKLRTDLYLGSNKFLNYFYKFPKKNPKYKLFKERIIVPTVFSKKYSTINKIPVLFHPSDWWYFGLTDDMNILFKDTPLAVDKNFYSNAQYINPNKNPYPKCSCKMFPEQYYFISAICRKFPDVHFQDWTEISDENIEKSNICMFNNFIFLNYYSHKINSLKHPKVVIGNDLYKSRLDGLLTYADFLNMYRKYCDKFSLKPIEYLRFFYAIIEHKRRYRKGKW